jgi:hypothetical protein
MVLEAVRWPPESMLSVGYSIHIRDAEGEASGQGCGTFVDGPFHVELQARGRAAGAKPRTPKATPAAPCGGWRRAARRCGDGRCVRDYKSCKQPSKNTFRSNVVDSTKSTLYISIKVSHATCDMIKLQITSNFKARSVRLAIYI